MSKIQCIIIRLNGVNYLIKSERNINSMKDLIMAMEEGDGLRKAPDDYGDIKVIEPMKDFIDEIEHISSLRQDEMPVVYRKYFKGSDR